MTVNTLNFCAFAHYLLPVDSAATAHSSNPSPASDAEPLTGKPLLLLAVPHTIDSEAIDIHQLPGDRRLATLRTPELSKPATGLTMALTFVSADVLVAGYEGGHVLAYARPAESSGATDWACVYHSCPHSQPVLSLAPFPGCSEWLSTAADAVVAKHRLASGRADGATLGGDEAVPEVTPMKTVRTGHAGQQGARVRDDGKICATAGWDKRVRAYAGEGLREVAVLKWHKEGCYAVDFASVLPRTETLLTDARQRKIENQRALEGGIDNDVPESELTAGPIAPQNNGEESVVRTAPTLSARKREERVRGTHWLAVGSKDDRVSLWDIF